MDLLYHINFIAVVASLLFLVAIISLVVKKYLSAKHKSVSEKIFQTINQSNLTRLAALLENNEQYVSSITDHHGATLLHRAAVEAKPDFVKLMLDYNSSPNRREKMFGFTPLHMLSCRGYVPLITAMHPEIRLKDIGGHDRAEAEIEIAHLLIKKGADVNCKASFHRTPLHLAALGQKSEVITVLLENGAEHQCFDELGFCPLHYAAYGNSVECMSILAQLSSNLDVEANMKYTALHIACEKGNKRVAEFLVENGADLNAKTENNLTPAVLASQHGHRETYEILTNGN